jgi:hypothetical protein
MSEHSARIRSFLWMLFICGIVGYITTFWPIHSAH